MFGQDELKNYNLSVRDDSDLNSFSHSIFSEKGNKAAGTRARKTAGEFKKIVTDYRKSSVAESN